MVDQKTTGRWFLIITTPCKHTAWTRYIHTLRLIITSQRPCEVLSSPRCANWGWEARRLVQEPVWVSHFPGAGRTRALSKGLPGRWRSPQEEEGCPTNVTAAHSNDDAKKVLHITKQTLWVCFSYLSFQITGNKCLMCTWNPRPSLPGCPEVKPGPNSPPINHGGSNQRENRTRALVNWRSELKGWRPPR